MYRGFRNRNGVRNFMNRMYRAGRGAMLARLSRNAIVTRNRGTTMVKRSTPKFQGGVLGGTNAHRRTVYVKRRMPFRKKRNWRRFINKVNAVSEKDLGSRTVLFNSQIEQRVSTTASAQQGAMTLTLYGGKSTSEWNNDLTNIGTLENASNPTASAGGTVADSTKVIFKSGVLDITFRNASVRVSGTGPVVLTEDGDIEVDIYDVLVFKEASTNAAAYQNFSSLLSAYDTSEIGGTGTGIGVSDRGATPFEFPVPMGRHAVKILKKTKYFVPSGDTITHQFRDPSRKTIDYGRLGQIDGFVEKGFTRIFYVMYKMVAGLQQGDALTLGTYDARIQFGVTRKYLYKIEGFNEDRERYTSNSWSAGSATS